ncbi:hypothetical protein T10_978 [Trichinella papuae]|uniref:Uncharacterized protein n=1 Tax=Trichinella papuae TaxID=268474 RepID=A0A0V1M2D1_9BILA|nr:hypothetical protein T10_978 [Trichinella papuae]
MVSEGDKPSRDSQLLAPLIRSGKNLDPLDAVPSRACSLIRFCQNRSGMSSTSDCEFDSGFKHLFSDVQSSSVRRCFRSNDHIASSPGLDDGLS